MKVTAIDNQEQLDGFVGQQDKAQFLQSWQWGEFQRSVSGKIWRLAVQADDGELIASAKIIKKELPMGRSYFYCGRGPVLKSGSIKDEAGQMLLAEIKRLAMEEQVMFMRFDPTFDISELGSEIIQTIDVQPSKTALLDLTKSEEELLKAMHQKTRYNIRLAEKKGVKIVEAGKERFEDFWSLMSTTSDRDDFNLHGRNYYQQMLELDSGFLKLIFAELDGKVLVGNIVTFFGDTVTYVHGGSSNESREAMAPFLLQWYTITKARQMGFKYYDFMGVDDQKWPGVTRFKMNFGPIEVKYPGTFDLVYDSGWYNIYKMIRKVRRSF